MLDLVQHALPDEASPLHRPASLDHDFARLALISCARHLDALGPPDPDRLVVSTDWLAWRQGRAQGHAVVHFESMLGDWPVAAGDPDELHRSATPWMVVDGADLTDFHGVSLGRQVDADVAFLARAHHRLWHALDLLCAAHQPKTIELHDYRGEYDILDPDARRRLVAEVAARHGAAVKEDRFDPPSPGDPGLQEIQHFGVRPPDPTGHERLRRLYGWSVATLFRLRNRVRARRPGIYLVHNWIVVRSLIDAVPETGAVPVLVAEQWPKNAAFLWRCWRRGVILINQPPARLDRHDRAMLAAMRARVEECWARREPVDSWERSLRELVRGRLFDSGLLEARAREAIAVRRTLREAGVVRVVAADVGNAQNRLVIEVARSLGIAVDEMLNGMFMTRQRIAARNGDAHRGPLVDRLLSWGPQNETWLAAIGAPYKAVRIGYPALDGIAPAPHRPGRARRALVLPLTVDFSDAAGLRANIVSYLIIAIEVLRGAGFDEITVKLHPGTPNLSYYVAALRAAGHDVPVVKSGPLAPLVAAADVVVGPVNSGAYIETAALGRPYLPLRAVPSSIDPALCGGLPVADGRASLERLLADGPAPPGVVLDAFCDRTAIPHAARRFWQVMNESDFGPALRGASD